MLQRTVSGISLLAVLLTAIAARAEGPLDAIPRSASVLLRLKSPDATIQKVSEFANKVEPQAGQQVQNFSPFLGMLISNPTMAGVDRTRDWHVAVFARSEQQPALVFVIPAKDANAMQQTLGQQFKAFTQGDHLIYSEDAEIIEEIRSRGGAEPITKAISSASQEVIDGSEVSIYLNMPRIREVYKAQFDSAREQVDQAIEQMKSLAPQQQGIDVGQVFDAYGKIAYGALQAAEDTNGLTIALSVRPDGILFVDYVDVATGTQTAEYLSESKGGADALLKELPGEKLIYGAVQGDFSALGKWGMQMGLSMFQEDESKKEAYQELMAEFQKVEMTGYAMALDVGDSEQGLIRTYGVMQAKPIEAMQSMSRKSAELFGEMDNPAGFRQTMELKADAERYGSRTADVITVKQEFGEENPGAAMAAAMMNAIWGPDGMVQRFVYLKDQNLMAQTMGGGRAAMEELLKAIDASSAGPLDGAAAGTQKALAKNACALGLIDLPGLVSRGAKLAAQSGQIPLPIDAEAIDSLKLQPSYAGLSVATGENSVRIDTYVPAEQIQGMVKLVQEFQAQMQNQQQQF